jgi:hypothetical protein
MEWDDLSLAGVGERARGEISGSDRRHGWMGRQARLVWSSAMKGSR